jgi:hypothetical protein
LGFWRREEPLHERLAREGGIALPGSGRGRRPPWDEVGIHGLHRQRDWDAVVAVEADAPGNEVRYVVLEDTVLVESDGELPDALAAAFDGRLDPPYRVVGIRRDDGVWALGGRRIETVELPGAPGETIDLAVAEDGETLLVDGERGFGSIPGLDDLARERGLAHSVIHAERLDGDLWEVRVAAL